MISEKPDLTKIPVQNIYYLLSYSWDKLEEAKQTPVSQTNKENLSTLFAKVLINGASRILKRGLDSDYIQKEEMVSRIRGQICFTESFNRTFMRKPALICQFDEFDNNILHNQIIKTTIRRMIRCSEVDREAANDLRKIYRRFDGVDEIDMNKRLFGRVCLNRNNSYYAFLINVCELIYDCLLPSEEAGRFIFNDFRRDHQAMARLFEGFVRNFYAKEQTSFKVASEFVDWDLSGFESSKDKAMLPDMRTDISLTSSGRKIIMDTKFYTRMFQNYYEIEKARSKNLYQIFAYIMNDPFENCEGILLYPSASENKVNHQWIIKGRRISLQTVNLNQNWADIHNELIDILN
ncbi:5-methylcytosine-specific restriction endonuclease system specificity protein McrC [Sedimentisphaera salicampi]|uniref:5-methylcytosine-specific restriction enzyme subunit McrC n=1 Tax=Sedimentisphaera salicampi TaxID=1941349 RepID=A0A1W6LL38_9BACT|nr:5-methylcytosine-specific restriction endonuclease system specificity protein McrC [Sedimentisphaera salicampi]ARN56489.1 5-methylcytosine-specific restriction enzyme subunit McrC [Sedimentisphaera salicampi]